MGCGSSTKPVPKPNPAGHPTQPDNKILDNGRIVCVGDPVAPAPHVQPDARSSRSGSHERNSLGSLANGERRSSSKDRTGSKERTSSHKSGERSSERRSSSKERANKEKSQRNDKPDKPQQLVIHDSHFPGGTRVVPRLKALKKNNLYHQRLVRSLSPEMGRGQSNEELTPEQKEQLKNSLLRDKTLPAILSGEKVTEANSPQEIVPLQDITGLGGELPGGLVSANGRRRSQPDPLRVRAVSK